MDVIFEGLFIELKILILKSNELIDLELQKNCKRKFRIPIMFKCERTRTRIYKYLELK